MPERFDLTYTGADNAEHRPVMIHRALMGSYERFIGILLEHTAGELPGLAGAGAGRSCCRSPTATPTSPPGSATSCARAGVRAELDARTESVGRKIREAELRKVPYMLVVGDREAEDGTVAVRRHGEGDEGSVAVAEIADRLAAITAARSA